MATVPLTFGAPSPPVDRTLVVAGPRIDLSTAGALRAQLGAAMGGHATVVVLDASAVSTIDGAGLRELLATRARLVAGGRELVLSAGSPAVLELLRSSGAAGALQVVGPAADAEAPRAA